MITFSKREVNSKSPPQCITLSFVSFTFSKPGSQVQRLPKKNTTRVQKTLHRSWPHCLCIILVYVTSNVLNLHVTYGRTPTSAVVVGTINFLAIWPLKKGKKEKKNHSFQGNTTATPSALAFYSQLQFLHVTKLPCIPNNKIRFKFYHLRSLYIFESISNDVLFTLSLPILMFLWN